MKNPKSKYRHGQAVVELAIFSSIIIFVLGVLIAYIQQLNDQQYIKMESFRRALQKANTYQGKETESPGASVQLFLVENRRHIDTMGGFAKGTTQTGTADASVYWAVLTEQEDSSDVNAVKINDDEREQVNLPNEFYVNNKSELNYHETATKAEDTAGITNVRISNRKETLTTSVPIIISQQSYRDPEGQYRYYSDVPESDRDVIRGMKWETAN